MNRLYFSTPGLEDVERMLGALDNRSPNASSDFLKQFLATTHSIAENPSLGMPSDEIAANLRVLDCKQYSVYFRFDPTFSQVLIERVLPSIG